MKNMEGLLSKICTITAVTYVLIAVVLVVSQAIALVTLNGTFSANLFALLAKPAGYFAATTAIISIILAYLRGEMAS